MGPHRERLAAGEFKASAAPGGGGPDTLRTDLLEEAVNRLTEQNGTLFVTGAGNSGEGGPYTLGSPASAEAALAVGAVDRDGAVAPFSGQGPRLGDHAVKPDLLAPGVGIVAARSSDSNLGDPDETHASGTGTSMASPHVAGAAALLFQQHPDWTPAQVKAALMASARPVPGASAHQQGAGLADLSRAITQSVLPEQPSLAFGQAAWPHADDEPVARTLTYRNTGEADVTLDLAVTDAAGPGGTPSAAFTLSETRLTVPAGGTADVAVTADTRGEGLRDGAHTARVVATGADGTSVTTPLGVVREAESYDVTIHVLGRDGRPSGDFSVMPGAYAGQLPGVEPVSDPSGTVRLRLPRGAYTLTTEIREGDPRQGGTLDLVIAPWIEIAGDRTLTVDARTARPVAVDVEREDASLVHAAFGMAAAGEDGGVFWTMIDAPDLDRVRTAQLGPDAPAGRFTGGRRATFAARGPDGGFADSPYAYHLAWFTPDRPSTGTRRVTDAELACVRAEHLPQGSGRSATKSALGVSTAAEGPTLLMPGRGLPMSLPHTREELYSAEGVRWFAELSQGNPPAPGSPPPPAEATQELRGLDYRPGRHYAERWNGGAVFGPSLPGPGPEGSETTWAKRIPCRGMAFRVPLFGQSADAVGTSLLDSAHILVERDGAEVCESNAIECRIEGEQPAGRYRVETEATRSVAETSTRVSAVWEAEYDGRTDALPFQAVRFSPRLDAANSARGDGWFAVPVSVQRNPGSAPAALASLGVEVSYDDGAHWQRVPVVAGRALLHHPDTGHVSLRARAADADGNTVEQTIIRAYALR
ncbi:S8 family serine peptidase [Streptomyces sp. DSM 44917]|uniref:S8 family serine peptidase n=1 Tax=Streptomyces boetiae TaxID=3075541 RepID=A0ABU2L3X6_9ACTN|nr:S8 family serine peptidase [Streptomyces sp. DSM 44917]MDT0306067.1 S8 family serine peptidase [Streptomyces sp. DSM 44917]